MPCSIKYIVLYTNVQTGFNNTDIINRLLNQNGIVKILCLPDVVVFEDAYAEPIVYTTSLNASLRITYHDPTSYKVTVMSNSPYLLTLNQVYSVSWMASVNGTTLPSSDHVKDSNGFNCWDINQTGNMNIYIYYQPQTTYMITFIISFGVIAAMIFYLIVATVKRAVKPRVDKQGGKL